MRSSRSPYAIYGVQHLKALVYAGLGELFQITSDKQKVTQKLHTNTSHRNVTFAPGVTGWLSLVGIYVIDDGGANGHGYSTCINRYEPDRACHAEQG